MELLRSLASAGSFLLVCCGIAASHHSVSSFRPETLTCRPGQNTSACLTGPQIDALHHIYATYFEANQSFVFNSYYPGGELAFFNGLVGPNPFSIALQWFQFFVLKYVLDLIRKLVSDRS